MKEIHKLMKRWVLYPVVIVIVMFCLCIIVFWCSNPPTTVLLVRHAEKVAIPDIDPPLSTTGMARAQDLMHVVEKADVSAIFATQYIRTQQTVQPAVDYFNLTLTQYGAGDIEGLTNMILDDCSGRVVLVAGHSNTVPQIIMELGGEVTESIIGDEYDNIYVVTVRKWRQTEVLALQYGEPSP
jgi:phosphohistidine phosphatase SixA